MKRRSATKLLSSIAVFFSGYAPLFLIMMVKDVKEVMWHTFSLSEPVFGRTDFSIPYFLSFKNSTVVAGLMVIMLSSCLLLSNN